MKILPFGLSWGRFFKDLRQEMSEDRMTTGAAALAYYLTLALFPALIFLLSILPFLPVHDIDKGIMDLLRQVMPGEAADMVRTVVEDITTKRKGGLTLLGLLGTIWAASSGVAAVMNELNVTYDVKEGRPWYKVRGIAIGLTFGLGLLIVGALLLVVLGESIHPTIANALGTSPIIGSAFQALKWVIVVGALLFAFAVAYYFGPDVEQSFKYITPGSVFGTAVFILASLGFKAYVVNFGNYSATYGSIGAVIVLMLWLYVSGAVFLLGSEVNALLEHYSPEGKSKGEKDEPASAAA
jgi:membrane protein